MAPKLKIPVCKESLNHKVFEWKHVPLSPVGFQISTQETWVLLLRQLEAQYFLPNMLWGKNKFPKCCSFLKRKQQAKQRKRPQRLPENPVELQLLQTDSATGSRWNSALQQGVVYMSVRGPSLQEPWQWLRHLLMHLRKHMVALILSTIAPMQREVFTSQGWNSS